MREIQSKLKEITNKIEVVKYAIEKEIDKVDFDKATNLLQETISSLEEVKGLVFKKLNT